MCSNSLNRLLLHGVNTAYVNASLFACLGHAGEGISLPSWEGFPNPLFWSFVSSKNPLQTHWLDCGFASQCGFELSLLNNQLITIYFLYGRSSERGHSEAEAQTLKVRLYLDTAVCYQYQYHCRLWAFTWHCLLLLIWCGPYSLPYILQTSS